MTGMTPIKTLMDALAESVEARRAAPAEKAALRDAGQSDASVDHRVAAADSAAEAALRDYVQAAHHLQEPA